MRKIILLIILLFPTLAFGQSYTGNYRAIFFNLFSEPRTIIAEFEVKTDNSLNGKIKVDTLVKDFTGTVDEKGKFEAVIEQVGNSTYKLKGKFDKNNKISLVQRSQVGSGLNKSVSENSLEGNFSKVVVTETKAETVSNIQTQPKVELIDNGKSRLKIQHSNPLFGSEWVDFTANITFSHSIQKTIVRQDSADYFNLVLKSKVEGQQRLSIATRNYSQTQKSWKANDLRYISYLEQNGTNRNFFSAGNTMQTDSFYSDGKIEFVNETDTQMVFKMSNFKIKRLEKIVEINGFIYADKLKP